MDFAQFWPGALCQGAKGTLGLTQQGIVLATATQLPAEPVGTGEMTLDTARVKLGGNLVWQNGFYCDGACPGAGNLLVQTHKSLLLPICCQERGGQHPLRGWMPHQMRTVRLCPRMEQEQDSA